MEISQYKDNTRKLEKSGWREDKKSQKPADSLRMEDILRGGVNYEEISTTDEWMCIVVHNSHDFTKLFKGVYSASKNRHKLLSS